jgi:hypothetical protein
MATPRFRALLAAVLVASLAACGGGSGAAGGGSPAARTWRLGFSAFPSRPDTATLLNGVALWSQRAELAIIHEELPWTEMLAGTPPDTIIDTRYTQLVALYRSKGLRLVYVGDLDDGLSRGEEAPQLRSLGRSIAEPAVQQAYRNFVVAIDRKLKPDYIALAAETNLIRLAAPPPLYAGVVAAANAAAADLRAAGTSATLFVSVQVETAWGVLQKSGYVGIAVDRNDFPFVQMLGYSSYPYFGYADPADLPADYYSRLLGASPLPVMVVEGGWTSASFGTTVSSPDKQARYIARQAQLLDSVHALGLLQLDFADLDLTAFSPPPPASIAPFVSLGLVDANYQAKPALAAWDALHARPLQP